MSKRLQEFDVLRVGATLAVIAIHVTAGYINNLPLAYLGNHTVRFAVPLFIVMSGYLLYYSDHSSTNLAAFAFYKKRLDRILWPYFIWTFIYCSFNAYLLKLNNPSLFLSSLGKNLVWGTGYYHLYFLIIILQLYLLYPLLRQWLKKSPVAFLAVSLVLTLVTQCLLYLHWLNIIALPEGNNLLYVRIFPVWLFYFVFGMFVAKQGTGEKDMILIRNAQDAGQKKRPLLALVFIWLTSLGLMVLDSKIAASQSFIIRPSVILFTISSYYFFYALATRIRKGARSWLDWLSAQSFLIYLMHPLLLTILIRTVPRLGLPDLWAGTLGMLGLYFTTTIASIAMTYIVSLTPLASWLGGVSKIT